MDNPIFLLASERCGTNLLRRRLTAAQGDVIGPSPLHMLKHLYFAEPYYGDFNENQNFRAFVEDAIGLAYHHFSPWDTEISPDDVLRAHVELMGEKRSAIGVMHALYTLYSQRKGYKTYFCKDNNLFDFVEDLRMELPEAHFIYLYRDPRDVVASQVERPLQNKSVVSLSRLWRDEQVKCIGYANKLEKEGGLVSVSYEELISNEEEAIDRIRRAIGVSALSSQTNVFESEQAEIFEWSNLNKPTMKENSGKFMKTLSSSAIRKIEGICWHQMEWLGYGRHNERRPRISTSRAELEVVSGRLGRLFRSRFWTKDVTNGQAERNRYIESLRAKWQ